MLIHFKIQMDDVSPFPSSQNLSTLPKWRLERILRIADVKGRTNFKTKKDLVSRCKSVLRIGQKRRIEDISEDTDQKTEFNWNQIPLEIVKNEILPRVTFEDLVKFGPTCKLHLKLVKCIFSEHCLTIDMILAPKILLQITIIMPIWGVSLYPLEADRLKQLIRDIFRLDLQIPLLSNLERLMSFDRWMPAPVPVHPGLTRRVGWTPPQKIKHVLMCTIKVVTRIKHYILLYDDIQNLQRVKRVLYNKYSLVTNIRNLNKYWCPKDCMVL